MSNAPGLDGYRTYWLVLGASAAALIVTAAGLSWVRIKSAAEQGQDLTPVFVWTLSIAFGLVLAVWGLAGLTVWFEIRRVRTQFPDSIILVSQKSTELDLAVSKMAGKDVSGPLMYLLVVNSDAILVVGRGKQLFDGPRSLVTEVRPSTTRVRSLDLPCIDVVAKAGVGSVVIPFQASKSPWTAIFPTRPSSIEAIALELRNSKDG
jgi:hypothetical protein